jgi:hypothetical protein
LLHRQQVRIALAGNVKAVAVRATPCRAIATQGFAIKRASQLLKRDDVHGLACQAKK